MELLRTGVGAALGSGFLMIHKLCVSQENRLQGLLPTFVRSSRVAGRLRRPQDAPPKTHSAFGGETATPSHVTRPPPSAAVKPTPKSLCRRMSSLKSLCRRIRFSKAYAVEFDGQKSIKKGLLWRLEHETRGKRNLGKAWLLANRLWLLAKGLNYPKFMHNDCLNSC